MSTISQLALAVSFWAAALPAALAAPWTQDKLLEEYPELKLTENAVPCTLDKQRVLILFDADKRAAALVSDCSVGAVRKLQTLLQLGDTVEDETPTCLVVLRADVAEGYKKRLPENDPLHAMGFLLRQAYYRPTELQADGHVLWATGKRRSLDILVPAVGTAEMHAVEVKAGMKIDNFAANVLARKLGYPRSVPRCVPARGADQPAVQIPCVIAATATPYKFPETCARAFGEDVLTTPPPSFADLEKLPIAQTKVVDLAGIDQAVKDLF